MRMLVATDGSPDAKRAVQMAVRLARELRQATVTLATVGQDPMLALTPPETAMFVDVAPLAKAIERAGREILDQAAKAFAGADVSIDTVYRRGDPSREIVRAADESQADVIIVGARGLGQIGGLILGSVSEKVLHTARCPVLVVR